MSAQEFVSGRASSAKTTENVNSSGHARQNSDSVLKANVSKLPSGKSNAHLKTEGGKSTGGKLLRETQIEERKRKNAERKAAVEERRKQKEQEDNAKNEALRQLLQHKPPSKTFGRKLPTVPSNGTAYGKRETSAMRRLSSSSSSSEGHTPPGSGKGARNTRRNLTGPSSASTSSLNSFGSGRVRTSLGSSKMTSVSTNNLSDDGGGKTGERVKEKSSGVGVSARRSLGSSLPKAQSMGAIHQVGHTKASRPPPGKKAKSKAKPVHHAGTCSEAEAGKALAEHRKKMREEAERKALLDKEKQEELKRQREEEEKRLAEENAREMTRQAELAAQLQKQEEERAKLLHEEREREAEIEAEKLAAELKRKEEMELLKRQEMARRAAEAERREKEEEERLMREEVERQERRKRVEMIMSRTRQTSTVNNNMTRSESYSSLEDLSMKLSDERHSSTVSEILQKVKEKSRASPSPEKDASQQKENGQVVVTSGKDLLDGKSEISNDVLRAIDNSKHGIDVDHVNPDSKIFDDDIGKICLDNLIQHDLRESSCKSTDIDCSLRDTHVTSSINCTSNGTLRDTSCTSRSTSGTMMDAEGFSVHNTVTDSCCTPNSGERYDCSNLEEKHGTSEDNCGMGGSSVDVGNTFRDHVGASKDILSSSRDVGENINGFVGSKENAELWGNVEHLMTLNENEVKNNLEKNGIFAEDLFEDDEGEEGQFWKVVEGKRHISDVI